MIQRLAVVAIAGLGASAVCIGAAAAIGGADFRDALGMSIIGDNCERIPDASSTSRDMDWDGSDQAGLAIPATANYTARSGDKLRANGDVQVLAHLRIYDGTVKMDCRGWSDRLADVTILPTPAANSASSPFSAPER